MVVWLMVVVMGGGRVCMRGVVCMCVGYVRIFLQTKCLQNVCRCVLCMSVCMCYVR